MGNNKTPGPEEKEFIPGNILIVEDEKEAAYVLKAILQKEGYQVVSHSTGEMALKELQEKDFDVVITDLRMPGMNGIELIQAAKKVREDLDFIVISGYGSVDEELKALRAGASEFIHKPIDKDHLLHFITRTLEKKNLEKILLQRTQQLVQSEKMATVGLLSTGIAHEINNPTTFIRTNLQLMKEYIKRLKPRLENLTKKGNVEAIENVISNEFPQMIDEALRGTDRIQTIVSGVKHYAHMGEDSLGELVDIREVIAHAVTMVRAKLRKNITIAENYLNLKEIKGHFSKLEQVFVNLLVNSADAINDKITRKRGEGDDNYSGNIDVSATIIEGEMEDGKSSPDFLVLTFYDNGDGIPEEKMIRIFDPFFTTKAVGAGTGLGLYICYEIIKQHDGDVTVQSEKGEGTAFIIKLPVEGASDGGE